jgi:hypothetical protein
MDNKINEAKKNPLVEIRDAGDKGRGIFAIRQILKGDILCYYDGVNKPICSDDQNYMISTRDKHIMRYGYKYPKTKYGIGQLINDGACINVNMSKPPTKNTFELIDNTVMLYELHTNERENVGFYSHEGDNEYWLMARKNIKKNGQLYLRYGFKYWLTKLFNDTKDLKWRKTLSVVLEHNGVEFHDMSK